jgi:zinc protease
MRDSLFQGARIFGSALSAGVTIEEVESWPDRVRAATAAQVREAAEAVFRDERSVTAILLPEERS